FQLVLLAVHQLEGPGRVRRLGHAAAGHPLMEVRRTRFRILAGADDGRRTRYLRVLFAESRAMVTKVTPRRAGIRWIREENATGRSAPRSRFALTSSILLQVSDAASDFREF